MKPILSRPHAFAVATYVAITLGQISVTLGVPDPVVDDLPKSTPEKKEPALSPYFVVLNSSETEGESEPLPLKHTGAGVTISGVIADVEIRQTYHNTGSQVLEAIYVFPGSTRSAVHGLTLKVGDRTIEAEIAEKEAARKTYEKAKAENKSAALLEQKRPNVFQMNVGHILPGDEIEVVLNYTELLTPVERVYEFVFPTVAGPRYSNATAASADSSDEGWVANPFLQEGVESPTTFEIQVALNAGLPLQKVTCDTHPVRIDYRDKTSVRIGLDGSDPNSGNGDFVLRYRLAGQKVATGLLLHEDEKTGENFFLLTVQPPNRVTPKDIPGREYLFVLDVSGSMNGYPLDTAKALLADLVGSLRPTDRFNVLAFAGSSQVLAKVPLEANSPNIAKAIRFIDDPTGSGGTEMTQALDRALNLPAAEGFSRNVIVVTDGFVSFERETFEMVRQNLNRANLFSFGIGSSVNRFCIEGLARAGQGEPFVVLKSSEAKPAAARLRDLIASPVLTDVAIDFGDFDVYDIEPSSVPDVFADRPLVVFGKYRGKLTGQIEVTGISGGEKRTLEVAVETDEAQPGLTRNEALPYLWARNRIARLSDYVALASSNANGRRGGRARPLTEAEEKDKAEGLALGLQYNLLTRFTSFVAVDTVERQAPANLTHNTVKQPAPLPVGVPASAVGGGTIPEPSSALLWLAGLLTLLFQRRRRQVS